MTKILVIYGPTVTGKTALALQLARKFQGELISADSRQVYCGLDIGTGKVSFDAKVEKHKGYWMVEDVKIHGFDLVDPPEKFSVADFLKFANNSIIQIIELNRLPIIVGGTGFYIKALIDGIGSIGIPADQKLRKKLEQISTSELYQKLLNLDPNRSASMNQSDRQNPRRLIRAIEIALSVQNSIQNSKFKIENYITIGLTAPNYYLYHRADRWLQERLDHGIIEEVRTLINQKVSPKWLDDLGLEYRSLTRLVLGINTKDQAIDSLKGNIHNLIRRQKTWFKKFKNLKLFDISQNNWQHQLEKTVEELVYSKKNARR